MCSIHLWTMNFHWICGDNTSLLSVSSSASSWKVFFWALARRFCFLICLFSSVRFLEIGSINIFTWWVLLASWPQASVYDWLHKLLCNGAYDQRKSSCVLESRLKFSSSQLLSSHHILRDLGIYPWAHWYINFQRKSYSSLSELLSSRTSEDKNEQHWVAAGESGIWWKHNEPCIIFYHREQYF